MGDLIFYRPGDLKEALYYLATDPQATKPVAGGTDLLLQLREKQVRAKYLVDLLNVPELRFIGEVNGSLALGPLVTFREIVQKQLLRSGYTGLVEAAGRIGSPQVRNRGTIGGNIGRASPAGDCSVALLSLGAHVTLVSSRVKRSVSLSDFFTGPGTHVGGRDEIIGEIVIPAVPERSGSSFVKLGKRKALVLAVAAVAAYLELDEKARIKMARLALGSLAPTPGRSFHAERVLTGQLPGRELFNEAGLAALSDISPVDDLRASGEYRRMVTPVLVRRALALAAERAGKRIGTAGEVWPYEHLKDIAPG